MNKGLLLDEDSQSNCSFDSSQICSSVSRTASIDSNLHFEQIQQRFMTPIGKTRSIDQVLSQRTASIQKPRIFIHSEKQNLQHQSDFQLGFFMGKGKKNVLLNQSKIKKGKNFFDDDETTFNEDLFTNHSMFEIPKSRVIDQVKEEILEFSVPCFKNMGKNKKIQIDQNLLDKAKNFFNDDMQDTMFPSFQKQTDIEQIQLLSFRKPTKVKKHFNSASGNQQNYIKTVNVNKKQKRQETKKCIKKQIFDWSKFQMSSKKLISKHESFRKSSTKKSSNLKSKSKSAKNIVFQSLLLQDLQLKRFQDPQKLSMFKQKLSDFSTITFAHQQKQCHVPKCLLCDLKIQDNQLNLEKIEQIFSQKLILQKFDTAKFIQLYGQICFKLLKYETFFPQIINKNLNPSNILVEMHKKSKLIQSGVPHLGWLDFCIKESKFFHSFLAQVRQVYHSQKIKTYFVLLSDGWSNVWAVVTEKNYLYKYVHKLKLCSKVFVGYWKHYFLANILSFCQKAKPGQKCIEIWYNSTIIVNQNLKIGKPKSLIFYRPLNLIRKQGGIIPTVQGMVIRMFCPSVPKQKSYSTSSQLNTFNENYVEIITPQGFTILIKLVLPSEKSLAEIFRLYYRYHFYFLKIGQKDSILQFNDQISKFYEFDKKENISYEPQLMDLLKKRYINVMNNRKIDELKIGNSYDIKLEGTQGLINGYKFIIQNANQLEKTNSYVKGGACLYQQYELDHIQKIKSQKETNAKVQFYLKNSRFSNKMRSIPAMYEKLSKLS